MTLTQPFMGSGALTQREAFTWGFREPTCLDNFHLPLSHGRTRITGVMTAVRVAATLFVEACFYILMGTKKSQMISFWILRLKSQFGLRVGKALINLGNDVNQRSLQRTIKQVSVCCKESIKNLIRTKRRVYLPPLKKMCIFLPPCT